MSGEWFFEEFEPGQVLKTMGRTVGEAEISGFVGAAGIFEPLFVDATYAESQGLFGARVAPAMLILSFAEGLYVLSGHTHHGRAYLGLDELRLRAPVQSGDTIRAEVTVAAARRSASRPDHGVVELRHRVLNQDDAEVMTYVTTRLIAARAA